MRGIRGLAAAAAAALIGVAYAQGGSTPPHASSTAGRELLPDLIAYAAFHSDLSDLSTMQITSAGDVDAALGLAARHDRDALVRGWLSYAADVAAQSPEFVASVRAAERRYGRSTMTRITSNRSFVRRLPGSADATRLVLAALAADAARAASVAERHRGLAYSLQTKPWGGAVAGEPEQRLARIRALGRPGGFAPAISESSAARLAASAAASPAASDAAFGGRLFWDAVFVGPSAPAPSSPPPHWRAEETRPETLDAILSVAALRVLGAQQTQASAITYFLRDPSAVGCVQIARLQFYQCLSATRFVYEGEYCLAQHALHDMAMCISAPIRKDETYMTAFAAPEAPVDFAVAVVEAAAADTAQAEAAPAPELEGAEEVVEPSRAAVSLPGTAEAPTASPVVEVQPLPAIAAVAATPAAASAVVAPAAPSLANMGAGELFAHADELDEQGQAAQARAVRRALIARFPDSPLALLAAQLLAGAR